MSYCKDMNTGDRIEAARKERDWSQQHLADLVSKLGGELSQTGVDKIEKRGTKRPRYLREIAAALGVSEEWLLTGKEPKQVFASQPPLLMQADFKNGLPVLGFVRAGVWQESRQFEQPEILPIGPDPAYPHRKQYALQVQGESVNRRIGDGEYAICVEWAGEELIDARLVVVERRRGDLFEATVKAVKKTLHTVELWPDSNDPAHQTPVLLNDPQLNDGDTVEVKAMVIGVYRKI